MRIGARLLILLSCLILTGCSGIEPPSPDRLLTHPLGTSPLRLGMTRNEVKGIWGDPDLVQDKGKSKDAGMTERQEWVYYARMKRLPISYANLSKTMHIYFDGDSVTGFNEEQQ